MTDFTDKNIDFLSNRDLIQILKLVLEEIDRAASSGAHRSTTYLAVSAIEGLFGELLKLLQLQPGNVSSWPKYKGRPKKSTDLTLADMEAILKHANALPQDFEHNFSTVRKYRNYMHPARELKDLKPIDRSIAQLALACLNATIEMYRPMRFAADHEWNLVYGIAEVPTDGVIDMPQMAGDHVSLLVTDLPAERLREMTFRVHVPPDGIFNFVYNYFSMGQFMAARIEGRVRADGKGADNGRIHCTKWRDWQINGRYTDDSEPKSQIREHTVEVILDPPSAFSITVDKKQLELEAGAKWDFNPKAQIGFMTEHGQVSIFDLKVQAK